MASPHPIPLFYRILFNYFEPIAASLGSLQALFMPTSYLNFANPNVLPHYNPALNPLMTQMVGGWLLLAFNDAVTLRAFSHDVKVWRYIMMAHLLSDVVYTAALAQDLGLWRTLNVMEWRMEEWVSWVMTIGPMLGKVAFLMGWGLDGKKSRQLEGMKRQ